MKNEGQRFVQEINILWRLKCKRYLNIVRNPEITVLIIEALQDFVEQQVSALMIMCINIDLLMYDFTLEFQIK